MALAKQIFDPLGVPVITSHRFLDGFFGDVQARHYFVQGKVDQWVIDIYLICQRWQLLSLKQVMLLSLSLCNVNGFTYSALFLIATLCLLHLKMLFCLPFACHVWLWDFSFEIWIVSLSIRFGGLGIPLPKHLAGPMYDASRCTTRFIVDSIWGSLGFELDVHDDNVNSAHRNYQKTCDDFFNNLLSVVCSKLDPPHACALQWSRLNDLSGWLSVIPMEKDNFDLTAQEFRDALAICDKKPLLSIPPFVMAVVLPPAWTISSFARRVGWLHNVTTSSI